jgi:hypothetical protein
MGNVNKVALGIFVGLLLVIVIAYLIWMRPDAGDDEQAVPVVVASPTPEPSPTPTLAEQLSARLAGVTLSTSDQTVGELIAELSSHPQLAKWLVNEDLVRRFVASVNNVAEGKSPRQHLDFLQPTTPFRAIKKAGTFYVNPSSYDRYDLVVEVFESLDTEGMVVLYGELKPLIDEAYREISPPGWAFEDRLSQAIEQLLDMPVPTGEVELEEKTVATFEYADDRLASLTEAQRHMLRLGPDNIRRIQAKLREIQRAMQTTS